MTISSLAIIPALLCPAVLSTLQAASVNSFDAVPIPFTQSPHGFTARGRNLAIELTKDAAYIVLDKATLPLRVVNASAGAIPTPVDALPGKANFLIGNDPTKWRRNVATFSKVAYRGVLPGVDLLYYGNEKRLEYDFVVAPGTDPNRIEVEIGGEWKASLSKDGGLVIKTPAGASVEFAKPVTYQLAANGDRLAVASKYDLHGSKRFGFRIGAYDKTRQLVIDPVLVYGTYLGGSAADFAHGVAVDAAGSAYVAGYTKSLNFPTTAGALLRDCTTGGGVVGWQCQATFGAPPLTIAVAYAFVTKFNPQGTQIVYSTYVGGGGWNAQDSGTRAYGIAIDTAGNAYIAGHTTSENFPVTGNAYQPKKRGLLQTTWPGPCAAPYAVPVPEFYDAFVSKLDPTGSALLYSTYLGGTSHDTATGIAVNAQGEMYIVGATLSSVNYLLNFTGCSFDQGKYSNAGFPVSGNALYPEAADGHDSSISRGFLTKLTAGGGLAYSTYIGMPYNRLTPGAPFFVGTTAINATGVAIDATGAAYIVGSTRDPRFGSPACNGCGVGSHNFDDAFLMKLDPASGALGYLKVFGGTFRDFGNGVALDTANNAYVTGTSLSHTGDPLFPTTTGSYQATRVINSRGSFDNCAFVSKFGPAGATQYSTLLCAGDSVSNTGNAIAVDPGSATAVITGNAPWNLPLVNQISSNAPGGNGVYLARLNSAGNGLLFSSFIATPSGQNDNNSKGNAVVLDSSLNAYVVGDDAGAAIGTLSTVGAYQRTPAGMDNAFVSKVSLGATCTYSLGAGSISVGAAAGSSSVAVTTQAGCPFTATTPGAFLTITGGTPGSGSGAIAFNFAANSGAARADTILAAGLTFTVNQASGVVAGPALTSVAPNPVTAGASTLTLNGSGFDPASVRVEISGAIVANSSLTTKTATQLVFPANLAVGTYSVLVRNVGSGASSNGLSLSVIAPGQGGSHFVPITPCRAIDTRNTSAIPGDSFRNFAFPPCNIPPTPQPSR